MLSFGCRVIVAANAIMQLRADGVPRPYKGEEVASAVRSMRFDGASGDVSFDRNGDRVGQGYMLRNLVNETYTAVGLWTESAGFITAADIIWRDGTSNAPDGAMITIPQPKLVVSIGLLNPLSGGGWDVPDVTSAAKLAVDDINNNTHILPDIYLQLIVKDSACDVDAGTQAAVELISQGVRALMGAGCR